MNYQQIYYGLIRSRQKLERHKSRGQYLETHHIVPVCLGGNDDSENLILLTAREHFIAHRLLTKIYPKSRGLLHAVGAFRMLTRQRKLTSRQVEAARAAHAKAASLRLKQQAALGSHQWQTSEHRAEKSVHMTSLNSAAIVCPNCKSVGRGLGSMKRWHFDNCRMLTGTVVRQMERTCPHCGVVGRGGNMARYHFDRCKLWQV